MTTPSTNMSLDESIAKRKGDKFGDRRDRPFRGGFRGGFRFREERRGGDRGGFRKPFSRFGSRRFGEDRFGDKFERRRERSPREDNEKSEKFGGEERSNIKATKLGLRGSRFIKRTGVGARKFSDRPPREERSERFERSERPEREEWRERPNRPFTEMRRLRVSNLDFNITHKDLMELFAKYGSVTKNKIEYDDLGRSKGAALIEFEKHDSAELAKQEYDGAYLDGRVISVEFDDLAKKRDEPLLKRKVISKDYNFERPGRRRFDDEREDRDRERGRDFGDRDRDFGDRGFRRPFRSRGGFRGFRSRGRY